MTTGSLLMVKYISLENDKRTSGSFRMFVLVHLLIMVKMTLTFVFCFCVEILERSHCSRLHEVTDLLVLSSLYLITQKISWLWWRLTMHIPLYPCILWMTCNQYGNFWLSNMFYYSFLFFCFTIKIAIRVSLNEK